jgi:hypothetical protein
MAGVLQRARTISGLIYGTRELRQQSLTPLKILSVNNLHIYDRLLGKRTRKNADSQREMYNRFTLEAKYRCDMQGRTDS